MQVMAQIHVLSWRKKIGRVLGEKWDFLDKTIRRRPTMVSSSTNGRILIITVILGTLACSSKISDPKEDSQTLGAVYCPHLTSDPDGDGWGVEYGRACMVPAICQFPEADQIIDGWGWEQEKSCRVVAKNTPLENQKQVYQYPQQSSPLAGLTFDTTFYPFGIEEYPKTTCGDSRAHNEMYFAVTEGSPLWSGSCNNESWAPCATGDCLSKWDQIPQDAKKIENGNKMVREPTCHVPCGQRHQIKNLEGSVETTAVIYDACPANHWNNRFKEATEGKNPCTFGSNHVDLRKALYLHLNKGVTNGNISVIIDPKPI